MLLAAGGGKESVDGWWGHGRASVVRGFGPSHWVPNIPFREEGKDHE